MFESMCFYGSSEYLRERIRSLPRMVLPSNMGWLLDRTCVSLGYTFQDHTAHSDTLSTGAYRPPLIAVLGPALVARFA